MRASGGVTSKGTMTDAVVRIWIECCFYSNYGYIQVYLEGVNDIDHRTTFCASHTPLLWGNRILPYSTG